VNFYALDSETGRLMMIDLAECNDGFQPDTAIEENVGAFHGHWLLQTHC